MISKEEGEQRLHIIHLNYPNSLSQEELPQTAAAIGFFDGIHKGHQKVISTAVNRAKQHNMESAVITFHPHPSVILKNDSRDVLYITPLQEKMELLEKLGIDRLYVIKFDQKMASLEAQSFVDEYIIQLNIKYLAAGFDFTYGHKGKGDMATIKKHSRGAFDVIKLDPINSEQEKISSTKIRELLNAGNVAKANELLGRPYKLRGTVIEGEKRGRAIGYPTANIRVSNDKLLPKVGIYAVKIIHRQNVYTGMASIGYNPTFTEERTNVTVEVNLLDYEGDLYGEELILEWHQYIRDELKFDTVHDLIEQMQQDELKIREFFK